MNKTMSLRLLLVTVVLAIVTGLAACGEDKEGSTTTATTTESGNRVQFDVSASGFEPDRAETDSGDVEVVISNGDDATRTIVLSGASGEIDRIDVKPGGEGKFDADLEDGSYRLQDADDESISAELIVGQGDSGAPTQTETETQTETQTLTETQTETQTVPEDETETETETETTP
jgi:hypothetical protein